MNKREYPLPRRVGFPWDRWTLNRYQESLIVGKKSDYPPEYLKAVKRDTKPKIVFRLEIWELLQKCREYVKRNPQFEPFLQPTPPYELTPPSTDEGEFVEWLKELILAAAIYGEKDILQPLSEVATLTKSPEPDMHAVRAVKRAFADLFKGGGEDDWPLKKEVRERAIEILKKAGKPIPKTSSEWARIFRKAGLATLRQARRKSKR
jgi:hypothetical protein